MTRSPLRLVFVLLAAAGADATLAAAARAADDEKPTGPTLAGVLQSTPAGPLLERSKIDIHGWVNASAFTSPLTSGDTRTSRVFDDSASGVRLQQAYLAVERTPSDGSRVDVGGKLAALWGTDARLIHARGLFDNQDGREYQFDLLEAYLSARICVAHGLTVKVGKCDTPLGFEVIEPPSNALPSRSLLFGYALPATHTGMLATLDLDGDTKLTYGLVLGWDVWDDNNNALTQIAGFSWTSPIHADTVTLNAIVGAEREGNDHDLRSVIDFTWTYGWSDAWSSTLNADFGFEQGAAAGGRDATWWGVAGYATDKINDRVAATLRAEFFRDVDGTRLGTPARLSELTLGLDWTPLCSAPNLHLRPEVRWDHSFDGPYFDNAADEDQLSLALDLVFTF